MKYYNFPGSVLVWLIYLLLKKKTYKKTKKRTECLSNQVTK